MPTSTTQSHNNKKAIALAAAAAAVTTGAMAATTVHADTNVPAPNSGQQTIPSATVKTAQEQAQDKAQAAGEAMQSAATEKNSAQTAANTADQQASQAQSAVDTANQNVTNAKTAVSDAQKASAAAQTALTQAQANAQAATPDAIHQAQANAQAGQTAVSDAQTNVNNQQAAVNDAQTALNNAQASAKTAQDTVNADSQGVNAAQTALNTSSSDAQAKVNAAQTNLNNAQTDAQSEANAVNTAQADVTAKQNALNNANTTVETAKNDVSAKQSAETDAKTALDNAQADFNAKQSNLNAAQTALNNAQNSNSNDNVTDPTAWGIAVTANSDAKAAANEYKNGNHDESVIQRMLDGMTVRYTPTANDNNTMLSNNAYVKAGMPEAINKVTNDNQLKANVNEFMAAVLNSIRQALGFNAIVMPNTALVDDANAYIYNQKTRHTKLFGDVADFSDLNGNVDEDHVWNVDFGYGANDFLTGSTPYQTVLADTNAPKHGVRLADLKGFIFSVLLTGDQQAHGYVNGGLNHQTSWGPNSSQGVAFDPQQNSSFVLGTDQVDANQNNNYVGLGLANPSAATKGASMLVLTSDNVGTGTNYGIPSSTPAKDTSDLQAAVDNAQTALNKAKSTLANAKAAHDTTVQNLDAANTALANAEATVTEAQSQLTAAQTALTDAQTASTQAQAAVQTATNKLAEAKRVAQAAQADQATKQAALTAAQKQLATDQTALNAANEAVSAKQTALTKAKDALTAAQTNLKAKQDTAKTLAQKASDLANAQTLLDQARANVTATAQLVAQKQAALTTAQTDLTAKQAALTTAKAAAQRAHATLDQAITNYNAKKAAYNDAVAHLITDAQQYGDAVKLAQDHFTIKEGSALPSLALDNTFAPHRENSEITAKFMSLAVMPGDTLPAGTTIAWSNSAKAMQDAQHAGDYVENVVINFPDGSTITKQVTLHVIYNPALHRTQTDVANVPGLPVGAHIVNGQVVDANGHVIPGYAVINGRIVKLAANGAANASAATPANTSLTRSNLHNGQLPQTGEGTNAGLIGLGLAGMLGSLTLLGTNKKRRHN